MVEKSLKPVLELFFKTVLFFCIRTNPIYWYYVSISISIPCIGTFSCIRTDPSYRYYFPDSDIYCAYYLTCYHLTPACYHLTSV